jgi:hypothetical protein
MMTAAIRDLARINIEEITREQFDKFERQEHRINLEERQERLEKLRLPVSVKGALARLS